MDALTDILNSLRLKSRLYFRTELTAPWAVEVPAEGKVARFHIVIRGQCWLKVAGQEEMLSMAHGDLVVIPHGSAHVIADQPDTTPQPLQSVLDAVAYSGSGPLVYGGSGPGCCLVCGEFSFDALGAHPLLDNLPPLLSVRGDDSYNTRWLESAIGFIGHEAAATEPGSHAIIDRLAEIIFIQVVRATLAAAEQPLPFLSAFADPRISAVLSAIHRQPEADWSVEKLGQLANMSRTAFSNRFSSLAQVTPLHYVLFVRMQKACRLLLETSWSLLAVADAIGYQSEAAFSAAFKRHVGVRPGEYRRRLGAPA